MFLEAVMVCVDYSDFLDISLPRNKKHFDNIIVVTSNADKNTQEVCKKNKVACVITDCMFENMGFNKGKAINKAIGAAQRKDWVLITDADMIMPDNLRYKLDNMSLDPSIAYGTGRKMCPTYEDWERYSSGEIDGADWVHQTRRINIGVGFFQLVNAKCKILENRDNWYSEDYNHCGRSDRIFWRQFDPKNRMSIRDIITIHLGSDELGANWRGRTTKRWSK